MWRCVLTRPVFVHRCWNCATTCCLWPPCQQRTLRHDSVTEKVFLRVQFLHVKLVTSHILLKCRSSCWVPLVSQRGCDTFWTSKRQIIRPCPPASLSKLIISSVEKLTPPMSPGEAKRVMCLDGMLSLFCHLFRRGQRSFMSQAVTGAVLSLVALLCHCCALTLRRFLMFSLKQMTTFAPIFSVSCPQSFTTDKQKHTHTHRWLLDNLGSLSITVSATVSDSMKIFCKTLTVSQIYRWRER